jgi:hypothetical protein
MRSACSPGALRYKRSCLLSDGSGVDYEAYSILVSCVVKPLTNLPSFRSDVFPSSSGKRPFSVCKAGFDPKSARVGFLVDKLVLGQVLLLQSTSFLPCQYYISYPTKTGHLKPTPYNLRNSTRREIKYVSLIIPTSRKIAGAIPDGVIGIFN